MLTSPDGADSTYIIMHFSSLLIELWLSSVDTISAEDRVLNMVNMQDINKYK